MAFPVAAVLTGLSGLAGLFGNKQKQETSGSQTNKQFSTDSSAVNMAELPEYDSYAAQIRNQLLDRFMNMNAGDTDLTGYASNALSNINRSGDLKAEALRANLASRGLSYSPMAGRAFSNLESERFGESTNLLNTLPLLQRQMRQEDLNNFSNFFTRLPVGTRRVGDTVSNSSSEGQLNQQGTVTGNVGGGIGGGVGSLATTLAGLFGLGAFGGNKKTPSVGMGNT